jgi:hypothetical protein
VRDINGREKQPAIVYLHPWEIDVDQPRLPVGPIRRARHYMNTGKTEAKLRRLVRDFRFAPVRTVLEKVGLVTAVGGVA